MVELTSTLIDSVGGDPTARPLGSRGPKASPLANPVRPYKIAIIGDSYVADTGSTDPKSFGYQLASTLRARYGDAGPGYVPIATGGSAGFIGSTTLNNDLPQYGRWTDPRRTLAACGFAASRTGGTGVNDTDSIYFSPNATQSYGRGVADKLATARIYYTLRSTSARPGFIIRQNSQAGSSTFASIVSSGADFTGTISGGTLAANAPTAGLIPRGGALVTGSGVTANTVIAIGPAYGATLGGGAGNYPLTQTSTVSSATAMVAAPNIPIALDTMQTITHRFEAAGNNNMGITFPYGDILVHGIESYNGNAGVTFTQLGVGGTSAFQWASLDDTAQRQFFQLAAFDLVVIVLGHNDKPYFNPDAFGVSMSTIISRVRSSPNTKIILVRQLDASNSADGSTYHPQYDAVYQHLAQAYGCGYYDERTASTSLATYAAANAASLMLDGTHGNAQANTIIGNDFASKIAITL